MLFRSRVGIGNIISVGRKFDDLIISVSRVSELVSGIIEITEFMFCRVVGFAADAEDLDVGKIG